MNTNKNKPPVKDWHILIWNFLTGKTSFAEDKELREWIDKDPGNSELFEVYRDIWLSTTGETAQGLYNAPQAWQKIEKKINWEKTENRRMFISGTGIAFFLKIAALLIILFSAGFISSRLFTNIPAVSKIQYAVISTPLGSKTHLLLPDSTEVWLNAGSTLTYPIQPESKVRRVSLEGEAFFEVKTDKSKPFIVNTKKMNVSALGTSFNVKAYEEDSLIFAVLLEGSIEVDLKDNWKKSSYVLRPNQILTVPVQPAIVGERTSDFRTQPKIEMLSNKITQAMTSWKDEQWTISGEPLDMLAVLLERRYNIKIHIASELLKDYKFSGTIKNETFEQVLHYLRYTTPLRYKVGKGEVWWDIDPELAKDYSKILDKKIKR